MKHNSSTEMRPNLWDGLVVAVVLALAVAVGVYVYGGRDSQAPLRAVITDHGSVVETVDLSRISGEKTIVVDGDYTLSVTVTDHSVAVTASDCPTQDCVHTGAITRSGQTIVCLPAQVIVTLEGAPDGSVPDVIVG